MYDSREFGFQVSLPNPFSKAGSSTEESAETLKTTEAPETDETTSNPGKCVHFGFHFINVVGLWVYPCNTKIFSIAC